MTARPDTWMPMYWGDYTRDTGHLNAAGHGAYLMLIKHYWCVGKPLVDDDDELWRVACCDSKKEWLTLRPKLIRLFVLGGGLLRHKRVEQELNGALERTDQRRLAGRASAEARKRQREPNEEATEIQRPLDERSTTVGVPVDIPLQRNGRQSQSQSQKKESGSLRSPVGKLGEAIEIWNRATQGVLPAVREETATRKRNFDKRLRDSFQGDLAEWARFCRLVVASDFLTGAGNRSWRANFDWVLEPKNATKILEGVYANHTSRSSDEYVPPTQGVSV